MQIRTDEKILDLIEEYMQGSENPDLNGYREQTYKRDFADKSRFLWFVKHIAKLGEYRNKRILDVGCGFGWHAFTISLLDDQNDVVGIDILQPMFDGMSDCVQTMRKKGVAFNLTPTLGDICNVDLAPNSFDAIYSNEAIEHVHDMEAMLQRCFELLRPGGSLILINDQNILNRKTRDDAISMWYKREQSWEWCDYLRRIRPIEHGNAKPFAVMREEIVLAANPTLKPNAVREMVEATAGMRKPEIERAVANFQEDMPLPKRPEYDWCRNPETGEYAERLFDPFALAAMMRGTGFSTKVRHCFRKFPLNLANSVQFRPLNQFLFNVRPIFLLYGRKNHYPS